MNLNDERAKFNLTQADERIRLDFTISRVQKLAYC